MDDLCARQSKQCVVDGEMYTTDVFARQVEKGLVEFPNQWIGFHQRPLFLNLAGVSTTDNGTLRAARVMKIR